ncbi:MAG: ThuA domain-containing protein [Verrucomicrobiota bacterium]
MKPKPVLLTLTLLTAASLFALTTVQQASSDENPASSTKLKALLITGGCCHDYPNQKIIIPAGISERTNLDIDWTVIHEGGTTTDTKIPFYENDNWAEGYDVVVHNECFAKIEDIEWADRVLKPHKEGTPAVLLHCAMHCYRVPDDRWFEFCGVTSHRHGPKHPFAVINLKADHPVMANFGESWTTPQGELYYVEKVWDTATPLAHSKSEATGEMNVNVWTNDYGPNNTRVFATTIGHHNETMASPEYLDMLTRGTLWAAGKLNDDTFNEVSASESLKAVPAESKITPPKAPKKKKPAKK